MFDKYSKVESYSYSVDLGKPVDFFTNLINELGKNLTENYKLETLFNETFIKEVLEVRWSYDEGTGQLIETITELASFIAEYFNRTILSQIDLTNTDVFLIYKSQKILFSYGNSSNRGPDLKKAITTLIKRVKIFDKLCDNITDPKLKAIITNIKDLSYDQHFLEVVKVDEKIELAIPYIPFEYFDATKIKLDVLDEGDVIVDAKKVLKEFNSTIQEGDKPQLVLVPNDEMDIPIGLLYGTNIYAIANQDFKSLIKGEYLKEYYWLLFKDVFKKDAKGKPGFSHELLTEFKSEMKKPKLNKLLSYLKKNHYILKSELVGYEEFGKYFEEVNKIKDLQHISSLEFYVSDIKGKTALGIFTNDKIGTSFNLLHWIRQHDQEEKHDYYRDVNKPVTKNRDLVLALKPQIAFYFITSYFEDFIELILKDLSADHLKNFELFIYTKSLGEIDFLIKSDNRLSFIEAKTKMTDDYIEAFVAKSNKLLKVLNDNSIESQFYLISAYSDNSCERKRFFINKTRKEGYNASREGLFTIPYYFEVPIPQQNDAVLTCIAEPEYDKLKVIIEEICRR